VAAGTPEEVMQAPDSETGRYLKTVLGIGALTGPLPAH
jgi:excinuclease UvrABC ATPase subunit